MTRPLYDDDEFRAAYDRLPRVERGLGGAPEWLTVRSLVGDPSGRRVLDLGCGYGFFAAWAAEQGASGVVGIDASDRMLARARRDHASPAITYRRDDLDTADLGDTRSFDLVYSSLALHYVVDLDRLLGEVHRVLRPGGTFVATIEHPLRTAPTVPEWQEIDGRRVWPVDRYLDEGPRDTTWLGADGVVKQHRSMATNVTVLLEAGLSLTHLIEWGPADPQVADDPSLADERHRPTIMIVRAVRPV